MAKKKSKSKKPKKKSKKTVVHHVHKHLSKEVSISVGVVILLLILVLVKVPYEARETYTEYEPYEVEVQETVQNMDDPREERICTESPSEVKIEVDPLSPYIKPFGLNEHRCYANFKVWNQEDTGGKWTYQYVFDVSGKEVVTEPQTKPIAKYSSVTFEFESEECQEGDTVTGTYELVESPTTEDCEYVTVYPNVTITKTVTKQKEVEKERVMTKREPLWQLIIGYNRHEKA